MEKTGFKDRTAVKKELPRNTPEGMSQAIWDFRAPDYDQRSSKYLNAGTDYGVGHAQPVGSLTHNTKSAIPMGRVATLKTDEV